jgi:BNR/Asp-box repeat
MIKPKSVWGGAACAVLLATSLHAAASAPAKPAQVEVNVKMNGPQSPMPEGRLGRPADAIATDPSGKLMVAAWETLQGTCGGSFGGACKAPNPPGVTAYGYSTDGGKTWIDAGAPYLEGDTMTSGRPWLDRGGVDNQTFFLMSRAAAVKPVETKGYTPGGGNQVGILLYRGRFKDGKFTWIDQHLFKPQTKLSILRSPSVLAAKDGSGRVWVAISNLVGICNRPGGSGGQIEVFRSADEGKTWEGPVIVSPEEFRENEKADPNDVNCGNKGAIQILPSMALGTKNEIYITWQHGPTLLSLDPLELDHKTGIRFARSLDGGKTFSAPQELALVNSMRENPPVGYSKTTHNDLARIAVATGGAHKGRVYVTYTTAVKEIGGPDTQQRDVSSQVYLVYSDDQGTTWSKPVPLASEVPPTGVKRFWPTIAVRNDGTLDIVYMESLEKQVTPDPDDVECKILTVVGKQVRQGKLSSLSDIYWVQSTDGGASFHPPIRVTTETTNWCNVKYDQETTQFANFGDVLGIWTTGDRTFAVWPDGRNGIPDAYFAELKVPTQAKPAKAAKAKPAHG